MSRPLRLYEARCGPYRIDGTARGIANELGVSLSSVYNALHCGYKVLHIWKIKGIWRNEDMARGLFIPNLYRAVRGSEEYYGNADEIGRLVRVMPEAVAKASKRVNNTTRTGWTIWPVPRTNAPVGYRNTAAQHYIATKEGEDPIMGDAEEVADLIGTVVTNVRKAASDGRTAKGWKIRKASDEEVAEFERQWA